MAQISIPMSNKVGYSMFWNSMWDNKINFARNLKEDIFLREFTPLIFNDRISSKILKTIKFDSIKSKDFRRYNLHFNQKNLNRKIFYNYIFKISKVSFFKTKVWILKYQQWVIIYFFMYFSKFNRLKVNRKNLNTFKWKWQKTYNLNSLHNMYKVVNLKTKYSYSFFKKNLNKNFF